MCQLGLIETMDEISVGPLIGVVRACYHVTWRIPVKKKSALGVIRSTRRKLL
jgi:hypothetical protein